MILEKEFLIVDTQNHLSENSKRPKLMTGSSWAKWNNDSSFLIAGMESQRCLSHSWFLPEAQNAKFGVFSQDRII